MKGAFASVRMDENHPHWQYASARAGKLYSRSGDFRTEFGRDYTRIIHSLAYSRLKHKTQVFFTTKNDHISTRIDHVNQVNSVSNTIGVYLGLNTELISAIALGHDLGHSPFGHLGERILQRISHDEAGQRFWHEQQGLHVVDSIETLLDPTGKTQNLMLTYAVRDGIISHCGEVRSTVIRPREEAMDLNDIEKPSQYAPYTWEGCAVKIADKIAYLGRDIEDAVRLGILKEDGKPLQDLLKELNSYSKEPIQSVTNTSIMYPLITDICRESSPEAGLILSQSHINMMDAVMRFNYAHIYKNKRLEVYHAYARLILESVYKLLRECYDGTETMNNIRILAKDYPTLGRHFEKRMKKFSDSGRLEADPDEYGNKVIYKISDSEDDYKKACIDYIAGMTDTYAEKIFGEMTTF